MYPFPSSRKQLPFWSLVLEMTIVVAILPTTCATCYWPNGDGDDSYVQCPNALSCCLKGESCLSNGLCFTANFGILYRGACADKTWPIAECPRACYTEIDNGWANLFQCNTSTDLLTCNHDYTSAGIVCNGYGVGTYNGYTSANVTAAKVGFTDYEVASNTTSSNSTSDQPESSASIICSNNTESTHPSNLYEKDHIRLIAISAGLGAGLGVPLAITMGLTIYCGALKRKGERRLQHIMMSESATLSEKILPYPLYPAELGSPSTVYNELVGTSKGRGELPA